MNSIRLLSLEYTIKINFKKTRLQQPCLSIDPFMGQVNPIHIKDIHVSDRFSNIKIQRTLQHPTSAWWRG